MAKIDVPPEELSAVLRILQGHVPGYEVRAFGSRVTRTAKKYSDLDLVLMTPPPLTPMQLLELKDSFSESDLPFRVDVVDWAGASEDFRKIIQRKYVVVQKAAARLKN